MYEEIPEPPHRIGSRENQKQCLFIFIMKQLISLSTLIILFTVIAFSSCSKNELSPGSGGINQTENVSSQKVLAGEIANFGTGLYCANHTGCGASSISLVKRYGFQWNANVPASSVPITYAVYKRTATGTIADTYTKISNWGCTLRTGVLSGSALTNYSTFVFFLRTPNYTTQAYPTTIYRSNFNSSYSVNPTTPLHYSDLKELSTGGGAGVNCAGEN